MMNSIEKTCQYWFFFILRKLLAKSVLKINDQNLQEAFGDRTDKCMIKVKQTYLRKKSAVNTKKPDEEVLRKRCMPRKLIMI